MQNEGLFIYTAVSSQHTMSRLRWLNSDITATWRPYNIYTTGWFVPVESSNVQVRTSLLAAYPSAVSFRSTSLLLFLVALFFDRVSVFIRDMWFCPVVEEQ